MSAATQLFAAGVDEQLIMSRTGHSSVNGVRTYKRKVEKLQEITSDVLNAGSVDKGEVCTVKLREPDEAVGEKKSKTMQKFERLPNFTVSGGSNVSINITL